MSGATYSRTSGSAVLPGTWKAVLARHPRYVAASHERLSWDAASDDQRAEFTRLASSPLTTPPEFLRFNLAPGPYPPGSYPGAVPETEGAAADGYLEGMSFDVATQRLGIDKARLEKELSNFSGPVRVIKLPRGAKIYRTVGLTADSVSYGSVTNKILGGYWEPTCPSRYDSLEQWRQAMAVLAEWNGDYGYLEVELDGELTVLSGTVGRQIVDVVRKEVLPGGGDQYFIPDVARQLPDLEDWVQRTPLNQLLQPTRFGSLSS